MIRYSASSLPVSPKTIVRDSQINPLCLRVVLGRRVSGIETQISHLEDKVTQCLETFRHGHRRPETPGGHPAFPSWCFYVFLGTYSILVASFLQFTHGPHWPLNPKPHMPFLLLYLTVSLPQFQSPQEQLKGPTQLCKLEKLVRNYGHR